MPVKMVPSTPSHSSNTVVSNIEQIKRRLKELAESPNTLISSLSPDSETYKRYTRAYTSVSVFYNSATEAEYSELVAYIRTLTRPARIDPGTFGSFVFGCILDTPQGGNVECSPNCHNSVPPHLNEITPCTSQVWMVNDDKLVYRSGFGDTATIFRVNQNLTHQQWQMLMANGAKTASLYSPNGTLLGTKNVIDMMSSTAPIPTTITTQTPPAVPAAQPSPAVAATYPVADVLKAGTTGAERAKSSFFADWKLILIFIIVILAIAVLIYFGYKSLKSKPETQTTQPAITTSPSPYPPVNYYN